MVTTSVRAIVSGGVGKRSPPPVDLVVCYPVEWVDAYVPGAFLPPHVLACSSDCNLIVDLFNDFDFGPIRAACALPLLSA